MDNHRSSIGTIAGPVANLKARLPWANGAYTFEDAIARAIGACENSYWDDGNVNYQLVATAGERFKHEQHQN